MCRPLLAIGLGVLANGGARAQSGALEEIVVTGTRIARPNLESASDYLDVELGYAFRNGWLDGFTLRAGVENLTDEQPPMFPSWSQANTDASQYDVLGRRYHVGATMRF